MADRRRQHDTRQDAGHLRVRPDRLGGRGLWESIRPGRPGPGARRVARPRPRRRLPCGNEQAGVLRDVRHRCAAHAAGGRDARHRDGGRDRKSTRLNSSHLGISYAVFCLKKKKKSTDARLDKKKKKKTKKKRK